MRITGGEFRSLKLKTVPDISTRETSEKIKEAVFNVLGSKVIDSNVLDLFAGSGAYGLEALSRNAKKCMFSDTKLSATKTILANIDTLKVKSKTEVIKNDYKNIINFNLKNNILFDIIFLDPPYDKINYIKLLNLVQNILNDNGVIVLELLYNTELREEDLIDLEIQKTKKYGNKKIVYLERKYKRGEET